MIRLPLIDAALPPITLGGGIYRPLTFSLTDGRKQGYYAADRHSDRMRCAMTSRNVVLGTIAASATLSLINNNAVADPLVARAIASVFDDVDLEKASGTVAGGSYTLAFAPGNAVFFAGQLDPPRVGPLTRTYQAGSGEQDTGIRTFTNFVGSTTKGRADSKMTVGPATSAGFSWNLALDASVDLSSVFATRGEAVATGTDPQFVQTPGVFAHTISLGPDSSVFTDEPDFGSADTSFRITAPLLVSDLADIELSTGPSGLEAIVSFATDPRLTVVDPLTGLPISAADVEARLRASSLGSVGGLTSPLPLFEYIYDLTGTQLPADASFGAVAESNASGGTTANIPEPSTLTLLTLGIAGMLCCCWWGSVRTVEFHL
jgi:hypothetical protein